MKKHLTKIHNVWYCCFSFVVELDGHSRKNVSNGFVMFGIDDFHLL